MLLDEAQGSNEQSLTPSDTCNVAFDGMLSSIRIRRAGATDANWVRNILIEHWHSAMVVSRGRAHYADRLPAFVALSGPKRVGLVTYRIDDNQCEIVTLNSIHEAIGVGTALIKAVRSVAVANSCRRLWLITTNDNLQALHFYRRNGFSLVARHRNAVERSRKLKPEIPLIGMDGIPIRDEMELEMIL